MDMEYQSKMTAWEVLRVIPAYESFEILKCPDILLDSFPYMCSSIHKLGEKFEGRRETACTGKIQMDGSK